jgi:ADP-heptose:LPS heptosyltransferase
VLHLPEKLQHIAVMRLSAMGDVAMTVPVLRAFANQYPEVKITVVSRPFFEPFFEGIPTLTFFAFDEKKRHKGLVGLYRLFQDLRVLKINAFADFHNVLRSKIVRTLLAISGIPTASIDKGRTEKRALTRLENKIFKPLPSMFERHTKVLQKLGFSVRLANPIFPKKAILDEDVLKIIGSLQQKIIGIAPFAQYNSKVYPIDLMQEVINRLATDPNHTILLFGGGKKEIEILNKLTLDKKNCITIAGKIKFSQELDLISNLDIMLSMDSGNAHIAAMLGTKVITLWGATHPYAGFSAFNQPLENALVSDRDLYPKIPTSIYGNKTVEGYEKAMRTISVEKIVACIQTKLLE